MMTVLGKVDVDSLFGLLWNAGANKRSSLFPKMKVTHLD